MERSSLRLAPLRPAPLHLGTRSLPPLRPRLEVHTGYNTCEIPASTPQDEYNPRSRHTFTVYQPGPTSSSSPSCLEMPPPSYTQVASSPDSASTSLSGPGPSAAPSRHKARPKKAKARRHPACIANDNDNLVVKATITHPYARLYKNKESTSKRRRKWNHAFETVVLTQEEISTIPTQERRLIYTASLEAHIDRLHDQLLGYSHPPVPPETLEPYSGLQAALCKSIISILHQDTIETKLKIIELDRAVTPLTRLHSFLPLTHNCTKIYKTSSTRYVRQVRPG